MVTCHRKIFKKKTQQQPFLEHNIHFPVLDTRRNGTADSSDDHQWYRVSNRLWPSPISSRSRRVICSRWRWKLRSTGGIVATENVTRWQYVVAVVAMIPCCLHISLPYDCVKYKDWNPVTYLALRLKVFRATVKNPRLVRMLLLYIRSKVWYIFFQIFDDYTQGRYVAQCTGSRLIRTKNTRKFCAN